MATSPTSPTSRFKLVAQTQEEEDAFNYLEHRQGVKGSGFVGSVANLVKSALGAGIMGSHVAYMKAGVHYAIPFTLIIGIYMGYCLHLLVKSAKVMYRRTNIPLMSYPDLGEASVACFPNPKVARFAKTFRYIIDSLIVLDLFGACACYQIIISKSIKQLVENVQTTTLHGTDGYPHLRVYLAAMMIPMICICLIKHLKYLAPFSIGANLVIIMCIFTAVYYAFVNNPTFSDYHTEPKIYNFFEFFGMIVFSVSCAGAVLPVENNMRNPKVFPLTLLTGMIFIMGCTFLIAFFGYTAFLTKCEAPITVNFPMTTPNKVLKGFIAVMIYVTHAVNFWIPFDLVFHYIKKRHNESKVHLWEYFYRALFVALISTVAIIFPNVNSLMGFFGAFCLTNMAIIWPNIITLLVVWHRPGLGKYKWRLWRGVILLLIGVFIGACGSIVNLTSLIKVFLDKDS